MTLVRCMSCGRMLHTSQLKLSYVLAAASVMHVMSTVLQVMYTACSVSMHASESLKRVSHHFSKHM